MGLHKDIYEKLSADFPKEAYSKDNSRGFDLTSLKAQYIIERLNQVLGIDGWRLTNSKFDANDSGVLYTGTLQLYLDGTAIHEVDAIGFSPDKKNTGDAYKGARTDALSKAASYIGVGNDMFKGLIDPKTKEKLNEAPTSQKSEYQTIPGVDFTSIKVNTPNASAPANGGWKRPLGAAKASSQSLNGSAALSAPVSNGKATQTWDD